MHCSTFLIAATALCATSASACFNTGEHWGDHNKAKGSLKEACYHITGFYDGYQIKQNCQNAPTPDLNFVFSINNKNAGGRTISRADCENNIGEIIDTCGHGGERTVNGVIYRYIWYDMLVCTRLQLLTEIGAIPIKGIARHLSLSEEARLRCRWNIRFICELEAESGKAGLKVAKRIKEPGGAEGEKGGEMQKYRLRSFLFQLQHVQSNDLAATNTLWLSRRLGCIIIILTCRDSYQ